MNTIIIHVLATVLALFVASEVVSGISIDGLYSAIVVAVLLGILNATVRPILIVLTLPVTILTLGVFVFVLNALLFWFVSSFVQGFSVDGFFPALLGSLFVSLASWFAGSFTKK